MIEIIALVTKLSGFTEDEEAMGKAYPGGELILTPPATPEPVLIDEGMVNTMLSEYKSHFPKEPSKG